MGEKHNPNKRKQSAGTKSTSTSSDASGGGTTINTSKIKVNISKNVVKSSETEQQAQRDIKRQSSITVTPQTIISKPTVTSRNHISGVNTSVISKSKNKIQTVLDAQGDSGTSTLSNALTAGEVVVKTFKAAQIASPHIVKGTFRAYHTGEKAMKVVKRVDATVGMIKTGAIKIDKDTASRLKNMTAYKIKNLKPVQKIIHAKNGVKTAVNTAKRYTIAVGQGVKKTVTLTRGIVSGTVKIQVSKDMLNKVRNAAICGIRVTANKSRKAIRYTVNTGISGGIKTSITVGKGLNRGYYRAADMLTNTDDIGAQALGYGLKTSHYALKAPKIVSATYKGVKTGINKAAKTGKTIKKTYKGIKTGVNLAKKVGSKQALKIYTNRWRKSFRGKATKALTKAGNSIVTAAIEGIKKLGLKVILPLLLILLVVMCGSNIISSFGTAVAGIFSPFLSDENGTEIDETTWLASRITSKRNSLIQDIKDTYRDNLIANGGQYHYVRFFNAFNDAEIELTDTNINTSIYTVSEYQQYIQPIFHTIILSEYDMAASEAQMQSVFDNLWEKISSMKTEELSIEYCNGGTVENDGFLHADIITCPNYSDVQYHIDDTVSSLCSCDHWYFTCNGHKGNLDCEISGHIHSNWLNENNNGCYKTIYHSGELASDCGNSTKHKGCNGYNICQGHKILALTVELGSFSDLLNDYYLNEIHNLESMKSRTSEEENKFKNLKDYYEICINYMAVLEQELGYGDGGVAIDLGGISLTDITDFACQFIGKPYIWGGNDPNTGADCSGYVKYIYANFGVVLPRTAKEQVTCGISIPSISEAQAGDLIFWSENGTDSGVYHVAMYLGNGKIVHASNSKPYPQGGIKVSNAYGTIYKIKRMAR